MGNTNRGAAALVRWMRRSKLSSATLAKRAGVARSTVHAWRQGKRQPGRDAAVKLGTITAGALPVEIW